MEIIFYGKDLYATSYKKKTINVPSVTILNACHLCWYPSLIKWHSSFSPLYRFLLKMLITGREKRSLFPEMSELFSGVYFWQQNLNIFSHQHFAMLLFWSFIYLFNTPPPSSTSIHSFPTQDVWLITLWCSVIQALRKQTNSISLIGASGNSASKPQCISWPSLAGLCPVPIRSSVGKKGRNRWVLSQTLSADLKLFTKQAAKTHLWQQRQNVSVQKKNMHPVRSPSDIVMLKKNITHLWRSCEKWKDGGVEARKICLWASLPHWILWISGDGHSRTCLPLQFHTCTNHSNNRPVMTAVKTQYCNTEKEQLHEFIIDTTKEVKENRNQTIRFYEGCKKKVIPAGVLDYSLTKQ